MVSLLLVACGGDGSGTLQDGAEQSSRISAPAVQPSASSEDDAMLCLSVPQSSGDLDLNMEISLGGDGMQDAESLNGELLLRNDSDRTMEIHWGGSWAQAVAVNAAGQVTTLDPGTRVLNIARLTPGEEANVPLRVARTRCDSPDGEYIERGTHSFMAIVSIDGELVGSDPVEIAVP